MASGAVPDGEAAVQQTDDTDNRRALATAAEAVSLTGVEARSAALRKPVAAYH